MRQGHFFAHCEIFSHPKICFYTENHVENLLAWSLHIDLYRATSFFQPPFSVKYQASGAPPDASFIPRHVFGMAFAYIFA